MITSYDAPSELFVLLRRHEGVKPRAYRDTKGILSAGVGRNLEQVGLSRQEVIALLALIDLPAAVIDIMLANDVDTVARQVAGVIGYDVWPTLSPARQGALIDMGFMGPAKLAGFVHMIAAIRVGDWQRAHDEALNSDWAKPPPIGVGAGRSECDACMLLTGEWPDDL